jgi:hypothetical protein
LTKIPYLMKKKLNIQELRVQSFVTTTEARKVMGGSDLPCELNRHSGNADYPSCNPAVCILLSFENPCVRDIIRG